MFSLAATATATLGFLAGNDEGHACKEACCCASWHSVGSGLWSNEKPACALAVRRLQGQPVGWVLLLTSCTAVAASRLRAASLHAAVAWLHSRAWPRLLTAVKSVAGAQPGSRSGVKSVLLHAMLC